MSDQSDALQNTTVNMTLKNMSTEEIDAYLISQYHLLEQQCKDLSEQYEEISKTLDKKNKEIVDRIEHILSLMTSNMMFIKQLINIEEGVATRLDEQERINSKQEMNFASVVDRQNRFNQCLSNLTNNMKQLVAAIEDLKEKEVANDKFKTKITLLLTIGTAVIGWLMSSSWFSKIIVLVNEWATKQ